MKIDDIKDPALRKLFEEVRHHSSTIAEDARDALEESNSDEELLHNWQSRLESLHEETQHFWGELEAMQQGSHKNNFCSCGAAIENGAKTCPVCGKTTKEQDIKCPGCGEVGQIGIGEYLTEWQCPECGWTAS